MSRDTYSEALQWLKDYNTQAEQAYYIENEAEWSYATNITDDTQAKVVSLYTCEQIYELSYTETSLKPLLTFLQILKHFR